MSCSGCNRQIKPEPGAHVAFCPCSLQCGTANPLPLIQFDQSDTVCCRRCLKQTTLRRGDTTASDARATHVMGTRSNGDVTPSPLAHPRRVAGEGTNDDQW